MSPQSIMYAGINAAREVAEAQTKANLDMWKAMESFAAVMPQPVSIEDMLAFANQTAKFFTQQK